MINVLTFLPAIGVALLLINIIEQNICFGYAKTSGSLTGTNFDVKLYLCWSIGTASANSVESDLGCTYRIYFDNETLTCFIT